MTSREVTPPTWLRSHRMPTRCIAALVATGTRQILGVVGDLSDTHSEILEKRDVANLILKRRGVLKAEDDAGLSFRFGTADVGCGVHWIDQVGILGKPAFPPRNVAHRLGEPLPD